jgi:DNA-directed RNA polymerase subunit RPC12/RpoP
MSALIRSAELLVRCPRCTSRLIAPTGAAGCDNDVIVDRHCPECGHRDRVVTTALAAAVWVRYQTRMALGMGTLADALADGSPVELSELGGLDAA